MYVTEDEVIKEVATDVDGGGFENGKKLHYKCLIEKLVDFCVNVKKMTLANIYET